MTVQAEGLNVTCLPAGSSSAGAPSSSSAGASGDGSGGSVPAYVWGLVGVGVAAAVAIAVSAVLLVRRRRLRKAGIIEAPEKDPERGDEVVAEPLPADAAPLDDGSPCNSPSRSTELQDGLWRSRCGQWHCAVPPSHGHNSRLFCPFCPPA